MKTGVSFNVEWVKKQTRKAFVKKFKDIYPKLDLDAIYSEITKKK